MQSSPRHAPPRQAPPVAPQRDNSSSGSVASSGPAMTLGEAARARAGQQLRAQAANGPSGITITPSSPGTPSLGAGFDQVPQTPERTPGRVQPEGTPLLSPTYSSTTPQKRRSTDFYTLLKSPKVKSPKVDGSLKRRSMELNSIINGETDRVELGGSYVFNESPKRRSTDIKRISDDLRTRLNYANVKIQHGWSDKSVDELHKKLEEDKKSRVLTAEERSKYDNFWKLESDQLPSYSAPKPGIAPKSPVAPRPRSGPGPRSPRHIRKGSSSSTKRYSLDEVAASKATAPAIAAAGGVGVGGSVGSVTPGTADRALFKALSPQKTPKVPRTPHNAGGSPMTVRTSSPSPENRLEQDAIVSLMSLSSPVKYSAGGSSPPTQSHSPSPSRDNDHDREHDRERVSLPPLRSTTGRSLAPPKFAPGTIGAAAEAAAYESDEETEDETEDEDPEGTSRRTSAAPQLRSSPIAASSSITASSAASSSSLSGLGLSSSRTGEQLPIRPLVRDEDN